MTLKNKKILIIIGGGIAAYKSLDLIRLLKKNGNEVKTILTKSGKEFVTPLSVSTLTRTKTFENIFDKDSEVEIDHIALSRCCLLYTSPSQRDQRGYGMASSA